MKKLSVVLCLLLLMFMFGACEKVAEEMPSAGQEVVEAPVADPMEESTEVLAEESTEEKALLPFTEDLSFWFSSGAGAWRTELMLSPDGTFFGEFSDTEMGSIGEEYPNGTLYTCVFSGKFENIEKQADGSYSMTLGTLKTEMEPGTEWIEDGILHIASGAYGLESADNGNGTVPGEHFVLYTPETETSGLNEEFLMWWPERFTEPMPLTLGMYGIWGVETQTGFFAW